MRRLLWVAGFLAGMAAACSSGGPESAGLNHPSASPSSTQKISFHTGPGPAPASAVRETLVNLRFSAPTVSVEAGRFVVHLVNAEHPTAADRKGGFRLDHDMTVTDSFGNVLAHSRLVRPGHDAVFVIENLPAGTYPFYCSIHVHVGMKGTLTVTRA